MLAARLKVSANYIQKILNESGSSFTERVLELRLQKARAMLADRRHDRMRIADIAFACGFNEVSYFNRCFRRRFGETPTQCRGRSGASTD
jgi:AraC-like DNA-binding protein